MFAVFSTADATIVVATIAIVPSVMAAAYSRKARHNTQANGGASSHDKIMIELRDIKTTVQSHESAITEILAHITSPSASSNPSPQQEKAN